MKIFGPEARGSSGAVTVSRNPFALYQRARNGRGGAGSPAMATAVADWKVLTRDQQLAWGAWASQVKENNSLGVSRSLSGFLAFVRADIFASVFGGMTLNDAPTVWTLRAIDSITVTDPNVHLEWSATGPEWVEIEVTGWESTGVLSPPGRGKWWKQIVTFTAGAGAYTQAFDLEFGMTSIFGARPANGRVFARARSIDIDSRRPGPWLRAEPLVW